MCASIPYQTYYPKIRSQAHTKTHITLITRDCTCIKTVYMRLTEKYPLGRPRQYLYETSLSDSTFKIGYATTIGTWLDHVTVKLARVGSIVISFIR